MMVAAAVSGAASTPPADPQTPKITIPLDDGTAARPPLMPSEKDNSNGISGNQRRPKSRIVSSRYMSSPSPSTSTSTSSSNSSSSSRRCPSPLVSRNSAATVSYNSASMGLKRSVSVDRRRPAAARSDLDPKADVSAAARLLVSSARSLSVSFQGGAFSLPVSKTKASPSSPNLGSGRKGTPERRRLSTPSRGKADMAGDHVENSKPADQHRWPGRNRSANKNLDCGGSVGERCKVNGSGNGIRTLQRSLIDERRVSIDRRASLDLGIKSELPQDGNSVSNEASAPNDLAASDTDSASSGSTTGVQESRGVNGPNGIIVSARFWQETNRRLRMLQSPGSPSSTSPGSKIIVPPKSISSPRMGSYPIRGGIRPTSPSKGMTPLGLSPSRGHNPSRARNVVSTMSNSACDTPSVLSYAVDVRRGKVGDNKIVDAHLLRLLHNRHLQWRFINARTEAVLLVQKRRAEKNLWNAWITISNLRDCLTKKRHRLQLLRQKLKLASILKGQMTFLEDWTSLDKDHQISLIRAIESLKASTLRLPVVGGAIVNVQCLQDAICSAVDIMQATASSIHFLLPLVEEANSLVTELAKVTTKERSLLEQCTDVISLLAALQVKGSSLRTHVLQQDLARTWRQD